MVQVQVIDKNADNIKDIHALKPNEDIDESNSSCMFISVLDLWLKEELDMKYKKYVNTLWMTFFRNCHE